MYEVNAAAKATKAAYKKDVNAYKYAVLIEKDGKFKPIFEKAWKAAKQFGCGKQIDIEGNLFPH